MTIEELSKEYANRHLDVSEELGCYLVKSVFLDGAEYQREKQDEFATGFAEWIFNQNPISLTKKSGLDNSYMRKQTKELLEIYKEELYGK